VVFAGSGSPEHHVSPGTDVHATLSWNPEDGWILSLHQPDGGLAWHALDAPADEDVAGLAARLVGLAPLAGATCSIAVVDCFRPAGRVELRAGRLVAVEDPRR
jgi:hypothetical protein